MSWWLVGLLACGWTELEPPPPIEAGWTVVHEAGWSMRVPRGASVRADVSTVSVDAADGSRWFDVRMLTHQGPLVPVAEATRWGEERCRPLRWDLPAMPVAGAWTAGGSCTIDGRRYWLQVAIEPVSANQAILTGLIASRGQLTYEDVWVEYVGTALSVARGVEPFEVPEAEEVRTLVRSTRVSSPEGQLPIPGGGLFSKLVSEALVELWAARAGEQPWGDAEPAGAASAQP